MADNDITKAILDGALGGVALGSGYMGLKYLISRFLENRRLDKLKEVVSKELNKQDIGLSGDIFKDVYAKKAASFNKQAYNYDNLPVWAALLTSGAVAGGGTIYGLQSLMNSKNEDTPEFADNYRKLQKRKFLRAAKLLRAVTDDKTMRDIDKMDKESSFKKYAVDSHLTGEGVAGAGWFTKYLLDLLYRSGGALGRGLVEQYRGIGETLSLEKNKDIVPILKAVGIIGAGGLGIYALRKLLKRQAAGKKMITARDDAINAWLSQRKESGDADRTLNAFITRNDKAERKKLNEILKHYEQNYSASDAEGLQA